MRKENDWQKALDKHFPEYFESAYYEKEDTNLGDELKRFIKQTHKDLLKKVREGVPQMRSVDMSERLDNFRNHGWNRCLIEFLHRLEKIEKELG